MTVKKSEGATDVQIEKQSYRMMDKMAAAILEDPDFQSGFFRKTGLGAEAKKN